MSNYWLTLGLLAVAVWVGTIVFHSFVVAPTVFGSLDEAAARGFLRRLFPRFYRLGLACGLLLLVGLMMASITAQESGALHLLLVAATIMAGAQAFSLWLTPRINAARDAGDAGQTRFRRLHRLSVLLTLVILLLGVVVLIRVPAEIANLT